MMIYNGKERDFFGAIPIYLDKSVTATTYIIKNLELISVRTNPAQRIKELPKNMNLIQNNERKDKYD